MALIKCEDCENEYSNKAKECPKCGCPTANNTISEKRKNIEDCSVKINGDEILVPKTSWISIFKIIIPMFAYWALMMSLPTPEVRNVYQSIFGDGIHEVLMFITGIAIPWLAILLSSPLSTLFPEYKERNKKAKIINEYFKKRFILLDSLSENYTETKIINKTNLTNDKLMFDIYMEAYKFNADAIVINDSNITTHISGSVSANIIGKGSSGTTTSTNQFHITATLVKY